MKNALIFQALCILPLLCGCSALCPAKTTAGDSAGKKQEYRK